MIHTKTRSHTQYVHRPPHKSRIKMCVVHTHKETLVNIVYWLRSLRFSFRCVCVCVCVLLHCAALTRPIMKMYKSRFLHRNTLEFGIQYNKYTIQIHIIRSMAIARMHETINWILLLLLWCVCVYVVCVCRWLCSSLAEQKQQQQQNWKSEEK